MKIGIVYESKTGNTKVIAEVIKEVCGENHDVIFESVDDMLESKNENHEVDLYFLGSWTDKGNCGDLMKEFCRGLNVEKVAIFGTAGFGGSEKYFESLGNRFVELLPEDTEVLGRFYCQGKMPVGIRSRYVSMLRENPEDGKLAANIENFDSAQSHPDKKDLMNAKIFAKEILEELSNRK